MNAPAAPPSAASAPGRPDRPTRPSRRALLRGAAAVAAAGAGLASDSPGALAEPPWRLPRTAPARPAPAAAAGFPGAHWAPADPSNYTPAARPADHPVDRIVVHVAQQTYAGTVEIFRNPAREVSAHYVVASDGRVAQCLREADIGWHAGNWDYNTRSIGIEHEGWVDEPSWFTDAMYRRSAELAAHLCATHGIPRSREGIIGHHEVPGATHTDPGPLWDWGRYLRLVNSL